MQMRGYNLANFSFLKKEWEECFCLSFTLLKEKEKGGKSFFPMLRPSLSLFFASWERRMLFSSILYEAAPGEEKQGNSGGTLKKLFSDFRDLLFGTKSSKECISFLKKGLSSPNSSPLTAARSSQGSCGGSQSGG